MSSHLTEKLRTQEPEGNSWNQATRWWRETDPERVWSAVMGRSHSIRDRHEGRKREHLLYASLYGNLPRLGFGIHNYARVANASRVVLNVCQAASDALVAKISKDRPRPQFCTDDADYETRQKAELLDKYVEGKLYELDIYDKAEGPLLDACVYGTGLFKVFELEDDVAVERTYPVEITVDEREAFYGSPRTIFQRKYYDRAVLSELYPEHEDAIWKAPVDREPEDLDYDDSCDQILVVETWHLKSGKSAKDGKHAICIHGATLEFEDFDDDEFPFPEMRIIKPPMGWWGIGLCERIAGIQLEINKLLRDVQQQMHLIARPHWMVEANAKVFASHLNNDIATIIKYQGAVPPQVYVPQAVSPEIFQHLVFLYGKAFEIAGVSQLSAASQKPEGLDSGKALRTYADLESERFTNFARAYQNFILDTSKRIIRIEKRIAGRKNKRVARFQNKNTFTAINWKDVDLKEDEYVMKVYPVSLLPRTPEGKLAMVQDLMSAKLIGPEDGMDLLDWPDTDEFAKRRRAARTMAEKQIYQIKRGESVEPDPMMNLGLAQKMATDAYCEAWTDEAPASVLQGLRDYAVACRDLQQPPTPPADTMAMPANGAPTPALPPGPAAGGPLGPAPAPVGPPPPPAMATSV